MDFSKHLNISTTPIPGLLVLDLPVHGDNRGWFKENWQADKMAAVGLPNFGPLQNNVSFNEAAGTTRGIHAEPWDKYVSLASGKIFGAWVDLRIGINFGRVFTLEMDPSIAVFVPRGVGNAFQTLEPNTSYSYLVNGYWHANAEYSFLNLADETVAIEWPIPLEMAKLSEKDKKHPRLKDAMPLKDLGVLILGESGQLAKALKVDFPDATFAGRDLVDFSTNGPFDHIDFSAYRVVINTVAYTQVDAAETDDGRSLAWLVNAQAVSELAAKCALHQVTLVHVSSDYVFDGADTEPYKENAVFSPLGVYGQTKAAGDLSVRNLQRHYIVRTSWVIGEGKNFVRTLVNLAASGSQPSVVTDQIGRLTFTSEVSRAIKHLISSSADYGTYNVTNAGRATSWFELACEIFENLGVGSNRVTPVSTEEFFGGKPHAPRPSNSVLDLSKIIRTGFQPEEARNLLLEYLETHSMGAAATTSAKSHLEP